MRFHHYDPKESLEKHRSCRSVQESVRCPIGFDTDVNAPAFYEYEHAKSLGADITSALCWPYVGTGVGVGLVVNGKECSRNATSRSWSCSLSSDAERYVQGLEDWTIPMGVEAWHSLALAKQSNVSIAQLKDLKDDNPIWDTAAYYLAVLCVNLILIVSPENRTWIGVFNRTSGLYDKGRSKVFFIGYIQVDSVTTSKIDSFIVSPIHKG